MKVETLRLDTEVEGDKRQKAPYVTRWTCPDCGTVNEEDHSDRDHFSYPIFGKPKPFTLYCPTCDDAGQKSEKGTVPMTVDIMVTLEDDAVVTMPRTEALLCIGTLRQQATVFQEAHNEFAANACRMLSERLYKATHRGPPPPKTRYDHLREGDDE